MDITTVLLGLDYLLACWTSTELVQSESILFHDSRSRMMLFINSIGLIAAISQFLPGGVHESNHGMGSCPPFKGTFTVKQYQLYPENADFDFKSCLPTLHWVRTSRPTFEPHLDVLCLHLKPTFHSRSELEYLTLHRNLFNSSVGTYDPYEDKIVDMIEFSGISHNPEYHIGGLGIDKRTGQLSIVVDAAAAFQTTPPDVSGTNLIMLWDPTTRELLYKVNLTDTTHGKYGGFKDVEQDPMETSTSLGRFLGVS